MPTDAPLEPTALMAYLDASLSPFHAARNAAHTLATSGSVEMALGERWDDLPLAGHVVDGGALVAWRLPAGTAPDAPMRLAGAHTDSPGLRVKPNPDVATLGWRQLGVEVYGGVLLNSWLDRDLGVAGRVVHRDGSAELVDVRTPIARVPQLAIHLDRTVNEGLKLDPQQHLSPVWGLGDASPGAFAEWLADHLDGGVPTWWELCLTDLQPAAVLGGDRRLLASGRLDNLVSCWAAVRALVESTPGAPSVVVLNDHEEVGSSSTGGASGPLLERVLERLVLARGGDRDDLLRALSGSSCISADNAHAIHPNYPDRHDPGHRPAIGDGPAIKINANQRYATSSLTAAAFQRACHDAGVPFQVFVSRNNVPCGSTIGPLTATRLGIATADVGVPQLSMHSARELCGVDDPGHLADALIAWFTA